MSAQTRPREEEEPAHELARRPLRQVLGSLADELEQTRALGLRVEGAICALAVQSTVDSRIVGELQQLDAVIQRIAVLRDYAAAVADACDPSYGAATRDALERVTLGDVRARLAGDDRSDFEDDGWEML